MSIKTREKIRLIEMGARDGLQSEKAIIPLATKIELINRLSQTGIRHIEAGSFVSLKWVPQMADSAAVFAGIQRHAGVTYSALTPNSQGLENALQAKADEVAIFSSASERFSQRNLNCDIQSSLDRFKPVLEKAQAEAIRVRGYVSCVLGCPYEGEIQIAAVVKLVKQMLAMGCYEVSLGDTIGAGTAGRTKKLLQTLLQEVPAAQIAMHMHDSYGQAIANIYAALESGIRSFDASVGGLGGCPYAKGATGNVASEDVLYLMDREGFAHGIDLAELSGIGVWINKQLNKTSTSRAGLAIYNKGEHQCA